MSNEKAVPVGRGLLRLLLLLRRLRRQARAWNRRLSRWLLLLQHQLPLLHFLQHLLRRLHSRLIRRSGGLFGFGRSLVRGGIVRGAVVGCFGIRGVLIRRSCPGITCRRYDSESLLFRQ